FAEQEGQTDAIMDSCDSDELKILEELKNQIKPRLEKFQASLSQSREDFRPRSESFGITSSEQETTRFRGSLSHSSRMLQKSETQLTRSQTSLAEDKQLEKRQRQLAFTISEKQIEKSKK